MARAPEIEIRYDPAQVRRVERMFRRTPKVLRRIMYRALKKTGRSIRTRAVKALAEEIRMPQKFVRKSVRLFDPIQTGRNTVQVKVRLYGRRVPLIRYKARQTAKGVQHKAPGTSGFEPSAFIARMPQGHEGVYKRTSRRRLPIRELYGPPITEGLATGRVIDRVQREEAGKLEHFIAQEVRRELEKR